jgi:3-dehydroquinate dehydratase type I
LGIVTAEMLRARSFPDALWTCGGVELRADGVPPHEIPEAVADFTAEKERRGFSGPVVFTLRLERDGGAWKNGEASARERVWRALPAGSCDIVDLEVEEIFGIDPETVAGLRASGLKILLSHHAFAPEPREEWGRVFQVMQKRDPDLVKFALMVPDEDAARDLVIFAGLVAAFYPGSCVMGMGAAGSLTRLASPLMGCSLTYGYLGSVPVAPGQLSVAEMNAAFARLPLDLRDRGLDALLEAVREARAAVHAEAHA